MKRQVYDFPPVTCTDARDSGHKLPRDPRLRRWTPDQEAQECHGEESPWGQNGGKCLRSSHPSDACCRLRPSPRLAGTPGAFGNLLGQQPPEDKGP